MQLNCIHWALASDRRCESCQLIKLFFTLENFNNFQIVDLRRRIKAECVIIRLDMEGICSVGRNLGFHDCLKKSKEIIVLNFEKNMSS